MANRVNTIQLALRGLSCSSYVAFNLQSRPQLCFVVANRIAGAYNSTPFQTCGYASSSASARKPKRKDKKPKRVEDIVDEETEAYRKPTVMANMGVVFTPTIPPTGRNLPSPLYHPRLFLSVIPMWMKMLFSITLGIGRWRWAYRQKLHLAEWKKSCLDVYVRTNKAFANRDLGRLSELVTNPVLNSLGSRMKSIDPNMKVKWEMLSCKNPKLVNFQHLPLNAHTSWEILLLTYRVASRQRFFKFQNDEWTHVDRDVVDYPTFVLDLHLDPANPGFAKIVGSVFETPAGSKSVLPSYDQTSVTKSVFECSDIYRSPPHIDYDQSPSSTVQTPKNS